jgi:hypothetical protein
MITNNNLEVHKAFHSSEIINVWTWRSDAAICCLLRLGIFIGISFFLCSMKHGKTRCMIPKFGNAAKCKLNMHSAFNSLDVLFSIDASRLKRLRAPSVAVNSFSLRMYT